MICFWRRRRRRRLWSTSQPGEERISGEQVLSATKCCCCAFLWRDFHNLKTTFSLFSFFPNIYIYAKIVIIIFPFFLLLLHSAIRLESFSSVDVVTDLHRDAVKIFALLQSGDLPVLDAKIFATIRT